MKADNIKMDNIIHPDTETLEAMNVLIDYCNSIGDDCEKCIFNQYSPCVREQFDDIL